MMHPHGMMNMNWKEFLGLNESQQKQLDALLQQRQQSMRAMKEKRRGLIDQLRTQTQAAKPESAAIQSLLNQLEQTQKAIEAQHYDAWEKTAGFLNPLQRGKLLLAYMGGWHGKDMTGMKGGAAPGAVERSTPTPPAP